MNKLQIKGQQKFLGFNIPIIEGGFGENQKVMLAKTIAEIHEMEMKRVNELINKNIDEFEFGVDILDLKQVVTTDLFLQNGLFTKAQWGNAKKIYLLSEQGYFALVMLMRSEKAKELRKMLRREYFAMREIISSPQISREQRLALDILEGNVDATVLKEYKEIVQLKKLNGKDILMNTTQLVESLSHYIPGITTILFNEWLESKELGTFKRVGNEKRRSFHPNETFDRYITKEGLAVTRKTIKKNKVDIEFTNHMLNRIIDEHLQELSWFVDEKIGLKLIG